MDRLDAATAEPAAEVSPEVVMLRLRKSVEEARAAGLPPEKVEAAAAQLAKMEEVVQARLEAEKELAFSLPGLFSKADPKRMRKSISMARAAGVAEETVADAEEKMARVLEREEEERLRVERAKARKMAEEAARQEEADAKAAELIRAGHEANEAGATDTARKKFLAAHRHSKRPSTLISAANMALKMGDAQTAMREYEKVMHASGTLNEKVRHASSEVVASSKAASSK